jgi:acyl-CoA thioester hydrolase
MTVHSRSGAGVLVPLYVRFADVDMMRVVHHAGFLHWFEQLRFAFLERVLGLRHADLAAEGLAFPVVVCSVEYLRTVSFDDQPLGAVKLEYGRTSLITFHYEIVNAAGVRYARGRTTHCCTDGTFKPRVTPPAILRDAVERARDRFPEDLWLGDPRAVRER